MDLRDRRILDIQLVQVSENNNEVKNSHHMEVEGLKRGLSFLEQKGCSNKEVITDRHVSVKKYMREEHKDKKHYYLPNLSPVYQTYALEVFHSVVKHFAPKNTHYFYAAATIA
ncbi:uncharacterized protein LOC124275021, partial [Haliotis rubra]|uniref:uncharacterized protein LOC124275021 n=1 Tax=Haliotis rubra TaxID=36100 RepID=UPI001EE503EB